jgi:hypothetical protein
MVKMPSFRILTCVLIAGGLTIASLGSVTAEEAARSQGVATFLSSADRSVGILANIAIIFTCASIVVGGYFIVASRPGWI